MTDSDLHESDFAAWAEEQAAALRERRANVLDWDNLAEEMEDMGQSQKNAVYSRLLRICQHLLKWQYQPTRRGPSWRSTLRTQRRDLARLLRKNPSLQPYAAAELAEAYQAGREDAADETGLLHLPEACPWTIEQVLDSAFLPGGDR